MSTEVWGAVRCVYTTEYYLAIKGTKYKHGQQTDESQNHYTGGIKDSKSDGTLMISLIII